MWPRLAQPKYKHSPWCFQSPPTTISRSIFLAVHLKPQCDLLARAAGREVGSDAGEKGGEKRTLPLASTRAAGEYHRTGDGGRSGAARLTRAGPFWSPACLPCGSGPRSWSGQAPIPRPRSIYRNLILIPALVLALDCLNCGFRCGILFVWLWSCLRTSSLDISVWFTSWIAVGDSWAKRRISDIWTQWMNSIWKFRRPLRCRMFVHYYRPEAFLKKWIEFYQCIII